MTKANRVRIGFDVSAEEKEMIDYLAQHRDYDFCGVQSRLMRALVHQEMKLRHLSKFNEINNKYNKKDSYKIKHLFGDLDLMLELRDTSRCVLQKGKGYDQD